MSNLVCGQYGSITISDDKGEYKLFDDGVQYMSYDKQSIQELVNHVELAKGDVIATGLGFGIREQQILTKDNVTKLTVIERNPDLIDYHQHNSTWIKDERVNIVHADANVFVGKCDVLLIDHFADFSTCKDLETWIQTCSKVSNNIQNDLTWAWPIEYMLLRYSRYDFNDLYSHMRDIINLPLLDEQKLKDMIEIAY